MTAAQMKMFLTRLGENVTVIVNGDITQCDLPRGVCSGLSYALERFEEDEMVGIVRFGKEAVSYTHLDVYKRQRVHTEYNNNALTLPDYFTGRFEDKKMCIRDRRRRW